MAWTSPFTAVTSTVIAASDWNTYGRDNLNYLKDRVDSPPRVRAYHSTTQSIGNSSDTPVALDSESHEGGSIHDTSTNNSRITIPSGETGYWLFSGYVEFAANATGQRKLALWQNGSSARAGVTQDAAAGSNNTRLALTLLWPATAADYFELKVTQNSGGSLNLMANPVFSAQRVA